MTPWKTLAEHLERRNDRRAAEIVTAVGQAIDESDLLSGLTDDILRVIVEKYHLETRSTLVRKGEK